MTRAHILVQALSGRGKTFWSCMGGKPYVIACEQKCRAIIPLINPEARVFPVDTKEDFDKAIIAVQSEKLVENGYTRIVLDSFSELTEYIPGWFGLGFPLQIQDYGTIGNKAMSLVLAMLKSPLPGIVICRSEAKEQGKVSRVVPGSLGKSASNLPAKLILTAETRHDDQAGWIVDTTPDDYTQRAGLPWVPAIFTGSADEFLAAIERGPAGTAAFTAPKGEAPIVPQQTTPERVAAAKAANQAIDAARAAEKPAIPAAWVEAISTYNELLAQGGLNIDERSQSIQAWEAKGPAALAELQNAISLTRAKLAAEPKTVGAAMAALPPQPKAEPAPLAEDFVDGMAQGHASPTFLSQEEWGTLEDLIQKHNLDKPSFLRFCEAEKHVVPAGNGEIRLGRMIKKSFNKLESILTNDQRRYGLVVYIKSKYANNPTPLPLSA